jgi:S-DNA-T family DNA segregation ATPase FtsK/SpoIIIE
MNENRKEILTKILKLIFNVSIILGLLTSIVSVISFNPYYNSRYSTTSLELEEKFFESIFSIFGNFYVQNFGILTSIIIITSATILLIEFFFKKEFNSFNKKESFKSLLITAFLLPILFTIIPFTSGGKVGFAIKSFIETNLFSPYNNICIFIISIIAIYTSLISLRIRKYNIIKFLKILKAVILRKNIKEIKNDVIVPEKIKEIKAKPKASTTTKVKKIKEKNIQKELIVEKEFTLPTTNLLDEPKKQTDSVSMKNLEQKARMIEALLKKHKITGQITSIKPGPVITLFEFAPDLGIKVSSIINREKDISLHMASSTRISQLPGRNVIGIELPNIKRKTVFYKELLENDEFTKSSQKLPMAIGQNISGKPVYVDLAKMPHLLIAGTTGSGKSVGVNSMILSLLYKLKPDECKFIMIDPKMIEFSAYKDIPHLLTPVVTDSTKAVTALKWAMNEMERRYKEMSRTGAKNIESFNDKVKNSKKSTYTKRVQIGFNPETGDPIFERKEYKFEKMPYIVVVVDEFADLMAVAGKEVEFAVQRLAQKARAAGIHLILATQRPSVDVITGVIKANFPSRISFKVTSDFDSKTILGQKGAEQLLGMGDMFYMPGGAKLIRVHGAYVSEKEVEEVSEYLRGQEEPNYVEAVVSEEAVSEGAGADLMNKILGKDKDKPSKEDKNEDLYIQAIQIVKESKKTSISYVQRCLRIGYNKAADIIDRMEKDGILSAPDNTGKRKLIE